jgi:hypothetical protein
MQGALTAIIPTNCVALAGEGKEKSGVHLPPPPAPYRLANGPNGARVDLLDALEGKNASKDRGCHDEDAGTEKEADDQLSEGFVSTRLIHLARRKSRNYRRSGSFTFQSSGTGIIQMTKSVLDAVNNFIWPRMLESLPDIRSYQCQIVWYSEGTLILDKVSIPGSAQAKSDLITYHQDKGRSASSFELDGNGRG